MELGWRGNPSQLHQKPGPVSNNNTAVQRMLEAQRQGEEPTAMLGLEQVLTSVEEGNMALVAVIFLMCCIEVMLIKAVTEISPSSVQSLEYTDLLHNPSVAYLTGQYQRPYVDDDWDFEDNLF